MYVRDECVCIYVTTSPPPGCSAVYCGPLCECKEVCSCVSVTEVFMKCASLPLWWTVLVTMWN